MPNTRKDFVTRVGEVVRAERKRQGLSQEQLALDADVDRGYMGNIERGEANITLASLYKITWVLRLKPSVLLDRAGY